MCLILSIFVYLIIQRSPFTFTFVIDTEDPLQELGYTLRTGVMSLTEAESSFTEQSRLAVVTQLSTPAPLDLQSCGLCDFTQPQGD